MPDQDPAKRSLASMDDDIQRNAEDDRNGGIPEDNGNRSPEHDAEYERRVSEQGGVPDETDDEDDEDDEAGDEDRENDDEDQDLDEDDPEGENEFPDDVRIPPLESENER